jgi:hypothetical protein
MFQPFKLKQVLLFQPVDLPPSEENGSTTVCSVFASHPPHLPSGENVGVPLPMKIPPTLETISKWGVCTCKVFPDMWTNDCRGIITICYLQQMQAAMGTRVACNSYTSMENLGASPAQYHIRAFNGNLTKKMLKLSPPKILVSPNII